MKKIIVLLIITVILLIQENYSSYKNYYILNTVTPFNKKILERRKCYDFTEKFFLKINNQIIEFRTVNITVVQYINNQYIGIIRLSNIFLDFRENILKKLNNYGKVFVINKIYLFDNNFNTLKKKIVVDSIGNNFECEDMRLFNDKISNKILFSGNCHDHNSNKFVVAIGYINENFEVKDVIKPIKNFEIKKNKKENIPGYIKYIENFFKNNHTKNISSWEKNWTLFNYKNSIHIIYKWFPLHICKINFNKLELIEIKEMPEIFTFCRGSTNGFEYDGLIWFIVHKTTTYKNYFHLLVIFDLNMNLKGYIDDFKFEGNFVEFCLGLVVEKDRVIISYSTNDSNCKICIYDKKYLENLIVWLDKK